ncbi:hypothetical protein [Melghirimyces algeriensis]|nr:hypothetical protein [Melghirimyces algeriensis]
MKRTHSTSLLEKRDAETEISPSSLRYLLVALFTADIPTCQIGINGLNSF